MTNIAKVVQTVHTEVRYADGCLQQSISLCSYENETLKKSKRTFTPCPSNNSVSFKEDYVRLRMDVKVVSRRLNAV